MTTTTTTAATTTARYVVDRIDGDWTVVRIDETGRQRVGTFPTRGQAREDARDRNTRQGEADVNPDPKGEGEASATKSKTMGTRAGKLQEGQQIVSRELGTATVTAVTKIKGQAKVLVQYRNGETEDQREFWTTSHVRTVA